MEVGSIAELTSAFASLVALVAAGIAARAAVHTNRQQGVQLDHLATEERERRSIIRAAQASQIAVWIELDADSRPQTYFANPSGLPIYAASIMVAAAARTSVVTYSVLAPRSGTSRLRRVDDAVLSASADGDIAWAELFDAGELRAGLAFRDAQGAWWSRDLGGGLLEFISGDEARVALVDAP